MKFWQAFSHHVSKDYTELTGYRLVGGQVLDVLEQLHQVAVPRAHAYIQVARCLELFSDSLVDPYLQQEPQPDLPHWVQAQALALYQPIPPLVTAAKQEAIEPDGTRDIALPWILRGRVPGADREPVGVFRTYTAAVQAVVNHVEAFLADFHQATKARLYLAEATTNYDSARYLLGETQELPLANRRSLDDYLWTALGYALGAVQEGAVPGIYQDLDIDTVLESRDGSQGSQQALGPTSETVIDLAQAWHEVHHHHDEHHHHEGHHEHHHDHDRGPW